LAAELHNREVVAAGLREEEVDYLPIPEPRRLLRLAWSARHAQLFYSSQAAGSGSRAPVTPEELFTVLDGRNISAGTAQYRIEVFSVRDESGSRWVQLALHGPEQSQMATVRLKTGDTVQHALLTLSSWLNDPASTTDVFNVA
jgi:hypothetical protein